MTPRTTSERGTVGRRVTLEQRRALLERIRADVANVVEDIVATSATLSAVGETERVATPADRATVRLIEAEQRRQQLELARLYGEYDSLAFRRGAGPPRTARTATAA